MLSVNGEFLSLSYRSALNLHYFYKLIHNEFYTLINLSLHTH